MTQPTTFRSWRLACLLLVALLGHAGSAWAQALTGTKTIGVDYTSLKLAIADLNAKGVGTGGVTFNIPGGYTETFATATDGRITVSSTLPAGGTTAPTSGTNPIVFQKSGGTTANPVITGVGTAGTSDAVIAVVGTDNVAFTNIDVRDAGATVEFGYALFRASATDGSQYVSITGATITLNKTNTGSIGIRSAATDATGATLASTSTAGANSFAKFNSNTVANAFQGVYVSGTSAAFPDAGVEIGSTTGNVLTGIGGSNTSVYGIRGEYLQNVKMENNTVTIPAGNTTTTIYGISLGVTAGAGIVGTVLINNNTVTMTSATTSTVIGINQAGSSAVTTSTITNNKVQNGALTGASGAVYYIQEASTSAATSATLTGNQVTNNTAATIGVVHGIFKSATGTTVTISNNTITGNTKSGVGTLSTSAPVSLAGIYCASTVTTLTANGNTISNNLASAAGVGVLYGIYFNPTATITTQTVNGNTISGNQVQGSSGSLYAIHLGYQGTIGTSNANNNIITNNTIPSTSGSTLSTLYGIYNFATLGTAESSTGNTVTGLSIGGTNTAAGNVLGGIYSYTTSVPKTVTQNTVGNLVLGTSGTAPTGSVMGIYYNTGTTVAFSQNKVYGLSANGTGGTVSGVSLSGGTTTNVTNNLIGDLTAPASTSTTAIAGLNIGGGTTVNAYFNTIYLNASSTGATFGTSAVYLGSTSTTLDQRNNIIVNTSTAVGTGGYTAAFRRISGTAGTVPSNYTTTSNNNLFYAGTPSAANLIYVEGTAPATNPQQTLAAYKAFMANRDQQAVTENPPFLSTTGGGTTFLHINPAVATQVESGGQAISGITTDFDGDTRNATPDIGADEGTFTVNDLTAPTISFTPLAGTASTADRTLTVTIADGGSGVAPASVLLYYRKAGGSYASVAGTLASGTAANGTYTFTLPASTLGLVGGNTVEYYVVAQDVAGNAAVSTSTGGSVAGSGAPATPAAYLIQFTYSGNYTIPTDFPTLTGTGGLFDQLNNNAVGGNLTVSIATNLTEPGTVALNQFAAPYTLTIQPDGTTERLISGSYASSGTASLNGLIRLNGADNVTFTGTDNNKYLRFRNTGSAPVFLFLNGANTNTLTYATVEGTFVSSAAGTITLDGTTANSGNTFAYNDVRDRSDATNTVSLNGIYASGTNPAVTIKGNVIRNFSGAGIFTTSSAVGDGWMVGGSTAADGNRIYQEATRGAYFGIQLQAGNSHTIRYNSIYQAAGSLTGAFTGISLTGGGTGHTVNDNTIGGAAADASGTPLTSTNAVTGISLAVGGTLASGSTTVQGNLVRNITTSTTAGTITGITATAGAVNIGPATGSTGGNTIGAATAALGLTASATSYGINLTATAATSNVRYNTVNNLLLSSGNTVTTTALYGILVSGATSSAHVISFNTISNIVALDGTTKSLSSTVRGIQTNGTTATPVLEGNQISNVLNNAVSTSVNNTSTAGIFVSSTGLTTVKANQISGVASLATAAPTSSGIYVVNGLVISNTGAGSFFTGNRLWNVYGSSAGTGTVADQVRGIGVQTVSLGTVANNQVSMPAGTNGQSVLIDGILDLSTGTTSYYYNSVYLAPGNGLGNTYAFRRSSTATVTLRNNIFYNERTVTSGTAVANYAIGNTGSATGWAAGASNYNLLVTADNTKVGNWLGTGSDFAGWKTASAGDANSYYYLPTAPEVGGAAASLFNAPTTGDLTIKPSFAAVVSPIESGGIALAGTVDNDYQGDIRQGSPGYAGTGTAPDLGSDEYAGTPAPALTFACSGVAVTQTTTSVYVGTTNQVVLRVALATTGTTGTLNATSFSFNAGGTTGSGTPANITNAKLYYTGTSGTFATTTAFGATVAAPTFSPDFTFTGSQALQAGTNYFFLTYDVPSGAAGEVIDGVLTGVTVGATSCTVPAAAGDPAGSRAILGPMFGDYTVGRTGLGTNRSGAAGEDFASLKLALADLNQRGLRTNAGDTGVRLLLTNNAATTGSYDAAAGGETFPLTIGTVAGSSATRRVVIKPQTGVVAAISGADTKAILLLDGADYVTIDGSNAAGTDRSLSISNTSTGTSSTVVWGQTVGTTNGATNNVVKNLNLLGNSNSTTLFGVGFGSSTVGSTSLGTGNNNNTVQNNTIGAVQFGIYSQGAAIANKNTGTIISQNVMTAASPANVGKGGIQVGFEDGIVVSQNLIDNIVAGGDVFGLNMGVSTSLSSSTTTGNEVTNATISRNSIGAVKSNGTSTAVGIILASAATGTNTIVNNLVSGVSANGIGGDFGAGIFLGGGAATTNVYFNSVSMSGTNGGGSAGTYPSIALAIGGSNPIVRVQNNVLYNSQITGTATTQVYAAIALAYSTYTNLTSDYNDLYAVAPAGATGTYVVGITGSFGTASPTTTATLAQWRTATGKDANSLSADPVFAGATLLPTTCPLDGAGVSIIDPLTSANYLDYANTLRSTPPDLGALEFVPTTTNDLQLLAVAAPTGTACRSTTEPLSVQVRNNGCAQTFSAGNPLTITVNVTKPNATVVPVTISVTAGTLAAGAIATYSGSFDMTDGGTYSLAPALTYAGDQTAANNSTAAATAISTNPVVATTPVAAQCGPTNSFSIAAANSSNQTAVGTVSGANTTAASIVDNTIATTAGTAEAGTPITFSGLPGGATVSAGTRIRVTLNITHAADFDVDIFLVGPGNTGALLLSQSNGGSDANYTNTVFDTNATTNITSGTAPFTGTFRPEGTTATPPDRTGAATNGNGTYNTVIPAGALIGTSLNGTWTLKVFDNYAGTAGTLNNWSLQIDDANIPAPFTTTITGPGTVGPVSYSGTNNANATATVTNAPVGTNTYTITTTNPSGCAKTVTQQVTVNPLPTFSTTQTNVSCFGGTGSITVTAAGGTAPYSYSLNNGTSYTASATNPYTFTGLAAGTYQVLVKGQNCTAAAAQAVTITAPASATSVTATKTDETAASANDGTVTATGTGGTSPYQYSLDGTNFLPATATAGAYTFTGVMAGSYTVTVRDANACTATTAVSVGTAAACTATTYTGAAAGDGSNWFNPANWTACVPSRTVDALVPAGLTNYPNLSTTATAEVRSLTLNNGARLTQSAGLLSVYGNLTSNTPAANATLTGGAVAFAGSVAQNLDGPQPLSFFRLTVNKADTLHVNTNQTVANALVLTSGILKTYVPGTSHKISLTGSATITETSTSFVLGDVEVPAADLSTDNSTSSFAGLGLTLTAHALKADNATPATLPGLTTVMRSTGTPLYGVTPASGTRSRSIRRRFTITPVNDASLNVDMVFGYNNSVFELNSISESSLRLFSAPTVSGPFAYAGGTPNTSAHTVSKAGLDHLSVWTLGDAEAPLPVELSSFVAERQGTNAALAWTTASEKNNRGFEVQVSTDGRSFRELDFVAGAGSSTAPRAYAFLDQEANKGGLRYYRLRQLDLDGTATFSPVRTVTFGPAEATALRLTAAPNPFRQSLTLTVDVPLGTAAPAQLTLTDAAGRTLLKQSTAALVAGPNKVELPELAGLASGVYFVHLALPGQPAQHLKVVKE